MKDLNIEKEKLEKLYNLFKDNDSYMLKEDVKYEKGVREILDLYNLNLEELKNLRNNFVEDVYNVVQTFKQLSFLKDFDKDHNIFINMLQYVTAEIDMAKVNLGGEV